MKFLKTIRAWWRGLFRKRRFNMLNATDNSEEWHMHLSPASIFAAFLSFVLLLFILFALVPIIQAVVPVQQLTDILNASRLAPLFDSKLLLSILGA